ncbi:uncharacterized protein BDW43DRAFT_25348 [Aspergillus alliaceus]|uniref:uncharacterized protein n=1 Tax=Petromyces alliaceus TaxID=209559 RepID=UPI0012A4E666|nr:uncharacterized protein BDW43DRAFT_25348 [Aspergillus alliaceus]KAB8235699.1 hypothetical protein BDW43DRAFT_25348 [Aspergillus alliaceus]
MWSGIASSIVARDPGQDAAQAAFHKSAVESWTLYAFGVAATLLRTYSRWSAVGFKHLRADDYLVWVAIAFYTAQTALAYSVGNVAHGLANNGMTDAQRATLSVNNQEYRERVIGSKIQVAGWTTYSALIWSLKLSMLAFYIRLTDGLGRRYRIPVYVGFFLVIGTFIASVVTIFAACRPFHKYWQINPDPGNVCQAAISKPIVWVSFAANVSTDLYLITIPIPLLWNTKLRLLKKLASTFVLSSGVFVLVCATLKSIFVLVDPQNGAALSGEWGTRETFVAVITTNLPMIFGLFKSWLGKFYGSSFQSSQAYKTPSGFKSIGGGGASHPRSRGRRGPSSGAHGMSTTLTYTESEERMVDDVKMHRLKASPVPPTPGSANSIMVYNQIEVTREERRAERSRSNGSELEEGKLHESW